MVYYACLGVNRIAQKLKSIMLPASLELALAESFRHRTSYQPYSLRTLSASPSVRCLKLVFRKSSAGYVRGKSSSCRLPHRTGREAQVPRRKLDLDDRSPLRRERRQQVRAVVWKEAHMKEHVRSASGR